MFWIILFTILGLAVGIFTVILDKDLDGVGFVGGVFLLTCLVGALAGVVLAGIGTGVIVAAVPESEYETVEVDRQEFAVSETGDVLYFDIQMVEGKPFIYYLTSEGKIERVETKACTVELTDSDYHVVYAEKRISGWYKMFGFPRVERHVTLYVPESVWLTAQGELEE